MLNLYILVVCNILAFTFLGWLLSLIAKNVNLVDSMWSLFFVVTTITCLVNLEVTTTRHLVIAAMVFIWAIRLSTHLSKRNWGKPEDSRYQVIRNNNEPYFKYKSIYIIFGLQAIWAAIISAPLIASFMDISEYSLLDKIGLFIVLFGISYESIADKQLKNFLSNKSNKVMDQGLWRYSRHPNYFGEFLVWWGFYLISIGSGYSFTLISPVLMSILLLKVSGAELLESTIVNRRPGYKEYIKNTSAFFPWPSKK
tara:strand:+ start:832 stop:1593 length:762 start_codon:yes stop_codon:yes gene_type:complete